MYKVNVLSASIAFCGFVSSILRCNIDGLSSVHFSCVLCIEVNDIKKCEGKNINRLDFMKLQE